MVLVGPLALDLEAGQLEAEVLDVGTMSSLATA